MPSLQQTVVAEVAMPALQAITSSDCQTASSSLAGTTRSNAQQIFTCQIPPPTKHHHWDKSSWTKTGLCVWGRRGMGDIVTISQSSLCVNKRFVSCQILITPNTCRYHIQTHKTAVFVYLGIKTHDGSCENHSIQ